MKKIFFILSILISLTSFGQKVAPKFATNLDMAKDQEVVLTVENDNYAWAIQVNCEGAKGTPLDGTVSIYVSLDGKNYTLYNYNFIDTITSEDWHTQFADKYLAEYFIKVVYKHNHIKEGNLSGYYLFNNKK